MRTVTNDFQAIDGSAVGKLIKRTQNFEDFKENDQFRVPEAGFDIHETSDLNSFLSFVNGPLHNQDGQIEYIITNSKSDKYNGNFQLGKINPFETKLVFFNSDLLFKIFILKFKSGG